MSTDIKTLIEDYERSVTKIILHCVTELPFPLGAEKIGNIIKGKKSSFNIEYKLYELSTFSLLPMYSSEQIGSIIKTLIGMEYLYFEYVSVYKNMQVIMISDKGRNFLYDLCCERINFIDKFIDKNIPNFSDDEKELFKKLRLLRQNIASKMNLPAYFICGDITLREITKAKPVNRETLLEVRGIGEKFVEKYGSEFIQIIEEYQISVG